MPRPRTRSPPPTRSLSADSPDNDLYAPDRDAEHAAWVAREYTALKAPPAPAAPLAAFASSLQSQLLSNPHSSTTAGVQTALVIDRTRTRVLQDLFNVPDDRLAEWDVVFTHGGATQGIKMIGDSWDWDAENEETAALEYLVESHTSLVGLRGYPLARGRRVKAHQTPSALLQSAAAQSRSASPPTLYAYPAQCNATGARLGLRYAAQIKHANSNAKILVDAAAYSSTSVLDLGAIPAEEAPDFVVASIYKIFGFPTSLGVLLVRRASAHLLTHSPYFGGGTISSLSLSTPFSHVPRVRPSSSPSEASISTSSAPDASKTDIHTILEAGTPPFLEIVALSHALDWLDEITEGEALGAVSRRTKRLRDALVSQLQALRHADGSEVFVEHSAFRAGLAEGPETTDAVVLEEPGPILGFSLRLSGQLPPKVTACHGDGNEPSARHGIADYRTAFVGHVALSRLALVNGIALRSGGLCNTGAWTRIWGMGDAELCELEKSGRKCWDEEEFAPFAPYRPLGITRVSLGLASTMADVSAFVSFVKKFFVQTSVHRPLLPSESTSSQEHTSATHVRKAQLTEVMLYPIKSCAAQSVPEGSSWPLTSAGLLYDREYMLVSASTGRALSQKRYPRMALIRPRIDLDRGELVVEAKGMPALRLPLVLESDDNFCHVASTAAGADSTESGFPPTPPLSEEESSDSGSGAGGPNTRTTRSSPPQQPQMTNLCGSSVASIGVSAAADAWFTAFLNPASSSSSALTSDSSTKSTTTHGSIPRRDAAGPGPVELHRLPNGSARHAHFDGLGAAAAGPPLPLRLSNESPFLLVSEESLGALNEWISEGNDTVARSSSTGDVSRAPTSPRVRAHSFRPNLVVGNGDSTSIPLAPFWEEHIDQFSISRDGLDGSSQSFSPLGKCRRCLMVAIDQNTGERTAEPLQTLTQHKKAADTGRVEFGMHCMWHEPAAATESVASISVGDLVTFTL
ncbi:hypothetical protein C6P46_006815 [Rhodotorula mucilaginosa]|uniref:MOSC domain-containing protein n=1 Tax=Rhodotorula mucilaginosa TaxID=5537 RepID=A0A9P6W884_RHOMI|nr:hypothetical protein C6P46_006815 [Rhodotorula mucilaginosa]